MEDQNPFVLRSDEIKKKEQIFSHPWNPNSLVSTVSLSRTLGLRRSGVNIARIPPGKESFVYHSHHCAEEWIYILSGRGVAEIDGSEVNVSAGDFMAFPTPSVAHHLSNPFEEELVYLMGGEIVDFDISDFPHLGKRMLRRGAEIEIYDEENAKPFGPL